MMGNLSFKKISAITLMVGVIGSSGGVMAGSQITTEVVANSTFISGNLANARNTEDNSQMIQTYDFGSSIYIIARQRDRSLSSCVTYDATAMTQLRAANSDAWLQTGISDGYCNNVFVVNSSQYAPKKN